MADPLFTFEKQQPQATDEGPQFSFERTPSLVPAAPEILDISPDVESEVHSLSNELGVPADAVRQAPEVYRTQRRANEIQSTVADTPTVGEFVSNPENLARVHDDVETLSAFERMGNAWDRGRLQVEFGHLGSALRKDPNNPQIRQRIEAMKQRIARHGRPSLTDGFVTYLEAALEVLGQQAEIIAQPETSVSVGAGMVIGGAVGAGATPQFGGVGAVPGSLVGAGAGFVSRIATESYEIEGGSAYIELINDGVPQDVAGYISHTVGMLNASLELTGAAIVLKPFAGAARNLVKKALAQEIAKSTTLEIARKAVAQYGAGVMAEVSTEVMQEVVGIFGDEIGKIFTPGETAFDFDNPEFVAKTQARIQDVFVQTLKAMTLLAAPGPGLNVTTNLMSAKHAKNNEVVLGDLHKLMLESKFAQRDPEGFSELAGNVFDRINAKALAVPADRLNAFFQSMEADEATKLQERLGIAADFPEAVQAGVDVELSARDVAMHLMPLPNFPSLIPDVRATPESFTAVEADEYLGSEVQQEIKGLLEGSENFDVKSDIREPAFEGAAPFRVVDIILKGHDQGDESQFGLFLSQETVSLRGPEGTDVLSIRLANLPEDVRGQGLGVEMYELGIQEAQRAGLTFASDQNVSDDAKRVWDALKRRGYPVVVNKNAIDESTPEFYIDMDKLEHSEAVQITEAERQNGLQQLFRTAEEAGMPEGTFAKYLAAIQRRAEASAKRLEDAKLKEQEREATAVWKKELEQRRQAAFEALSNEPVYQALNGIGVDRLDRAEVEALAARLGIDIQDLPKSQGQLIFTRKGVEGISVDAYAELYGYTDGETMLSEFFLVDPQEQAAEQQARAQMLEEHGDLQEHRQALREARRALLEDDYGETIRTELNALRAAVKAKQVGARVISAAAKQYINQVPLNELTSRKFLNAVRRHGKEAARLLRKGDRQGASEKKFLQAINFEMAKIADKSRLTTDRRLAFMRKFDRKTPPKGLPTKYVTAIRELTAKVSLRPKPSQKKLDALRAVANDQSNPVRIDPKYLENPDTVINYRDMTLGEFDDLYNSVKELDQKGRNEAKLLENLEEGFVQDSVDDVIFGIQSHLKPNLVRPRQSLGAWGRVKQAGNGVIGLVLTMDTMLNQIDGFEDQGPAYKATKGRIDRALGHGYREGQVGYLRRQQEVAAKLKDLYSVWSKAERNRMNTRVEVPGVSFKMTHQEIIATVLNSGNLQNIQAMVETGTLTEEEIQAVHEFASQKDWEFAQSVWDYLDTFFPEVKETEQRRGNREVAKVEATAIELPHGRYRGGYYPIRYDHVASLSDIYAPDNLEELQQNVRFGNFAASHTANGHTKARTSPPKGAKVALDMWSLNSHLDQVIFDLEVGDAVNDFYKVWFSSELRGAFSDAGFQHYWEIGNAWLRDTIQQEVIGSTTFEHMMRYLRTGFTISRLGWNVGVSAMQVLGLTQSAALIGHRHVWGAVGDVMKAHKIGDNSIFKLVDDMSGFMAARSDTFNKDMTRAKKQFASNWVDKVTPGSTADFIRDSFFYGIRKTQRVTDTITWIAGFRKEMAKSGDQAKAVAFADRMVTRTQGSGIFSERSAVERGTLSASKRQSEILRTFTPFMSYFIAKNNIAWQRTKETNFRKPTQVMTLAADLMMLYVLEALMAGLIAGQLPDAEDEDKSFVGWLAGETASSFMAGFPIAREFAGAAKGFPGGGVIGSVTELFGRAATQVGQGDVDAAFGQAVNNVMGVFFHYPAGQLNKTGGALIKNNEGKDVTLQEYLMGPRRK